MRHISASPKRAVAQGVIFSSPTAPTTHQKMAPSSTLPKLSSQSCPRPPSAELGALYINARKAVPCRTFLKELGHTQPPTPIQTDNSTTLGDVTNNILPRRLKAMDMRYLWLRNRDTQEQLRYYWRPGPTNQGDYFTKHHCAAHHPLKDKFCIWRN
jgi:hypothetical protein